MSSHGCSLSHREAPRDTFPMVFINQQLVQRRSVLLHWGCATLSTTETTYELPVASLMTPCLCHLQLLSKDSKHMFLLQKHKSLRREIMLSNTLQQLFQRQQRTYNTLLKQLPFILQSTEYIDIEIKHKTSPSQSTRILHNPKQHLLGNAFRYMN